MLPPFQMPTYHHQQTELPPPPEVPRPTEKVKVDTEFTVQQTSVSPSRNENVPPSRSDVRLPMNEQSFEDKVEPLMETATESYMKVYHENIVVQNPFDKGEGLKLKKPPAVQLNKPQKSLPDFNEAFGSTERGRFKSPPDPRLPHKQGYVDYLYTNSDLKFEDYHI